MLKQRFNALTERERYMVILAGVAIIIAIFYWGLWSPLNTSLQQQQTQLASNQKLLLWVEEQANRAIALRRSGPAKQTFQGTLPQAVTSTTARFNIAISRMQPQGDELQVWIDEAPFNDLMAWLDTLEDMGIVILQTDITEANDDGIIKVRRLVLGKL